MRVGRGGALSAHGSPSTVTGPSGDSGARKRALTNDQRRKRSFHSGGNGHHAQSSKWVRWQGTGVAVSRVARKASEAAFN